MALKLIMAGSMAGTFDVADYAEASRIYSERREESDEGASTFPPAAIKENGALVALVSYNGRVWQRTRNPDDKVLLYDPSEPDLPLVRGETLEGLYTAPNYRHPFNDEEFAGHIGITLKYGGKVVVLADALPDFAGELHFVAGTMGSEPHASDLLYINAQGRLDAFTGNSHGGRFVLNES